MTKEQGRGLAECGKRITGADQAECRSAASSFLASLCEAARQSKRRKRRLSGSGEPESIIIGCMGPQPPRIDSARVGEVELDGEDGRCGVGRTAQGRLS